MLIFLLYELLESLMNLFKPETRNDLFKGFRNFRIHKISDTSLMSML